MIFNAPVNAFSCEAFEAILLLYTSLLRVGEPNKHISRYMNFVSLDFICTFFLHLSCVRSFSCFLLLIYTRHKRDKANKNY